jgi:hypothetical protein
LPEQFDAHSALDVQSQAPAAASPGWFLWDQWQEGACGWGWGMGRNNWSNRARSTCCSRADALASPAHRLRCPRCQQGHSSYKLLTSQNLNNSKLHACIHSIISLHKSS